MLTEGNKERQEEFSGTSIYYARARVETSSNHMLKLSCIYEQHCLDTFQTVRRMQKRSYASALPPGYPRSLANFRT